MGPWEQYDVAQGLHIIFLTAQGADWYKYRDTISSKYLLLLDDRGVVLQAESEDKDRIFPIGFYTLTVDEIPEDFEPCKYQYGENGYEIYVPTPEEIFERNYQIQTKVLRVATSKLMDIQGLIAAEVATDEELTLAECMKAFMKKLRAVDLNNPVWPERPL